MIRSVPMRLLVALCLLAASCGLPTDDSAEVITDVSYGLLETTTTSSTTTAPVNLGFELTLYFISSSDQSLVQVVRPLATGPTATEALTSLVAGPLEGEQLARDGEEPTPIEEPFSELLAPTVGSPTNGLLTITVSDDPAGFREAPRKQLATQVIVCTVTEIPGVQAVEFRDSLDAIPLSNANAESIGVTATRADFDDCLVADENIIDPALTDEESDDEPTTTTTGG